MKTVTRSEINPIKMSVKPPEVVVNASFRVISNGKVYHYVGMGWVEERAAEQNDYEEIPELID